MSATFKQTGNRGVITLSNDLTLPHAEELKKIFIKALVDTDDVSIVMENVHDVDLSCLQMLCSAHRSAVRFKKKVSFSGNLPQALKDAVRAAGFERLTGCRLDCEKSCLWMAVTGANHD